MTRIRAIPKNPHSTKRNLFIVDASFLVEKVIGIAAAPVGSKARIRISHLWWKEIDRQVKAEKARVYMPDLCIAEAFKVLAKKYYTDKWFKTSHDYKVARDKLSRIVSTPSKELKAMNRYIGYHDVPASRDIVIGVDRFFELFYKKGCNVGVIDLIVVGTAKWLMDFFDADRSQLHVITYDKALHKGSKSISELPNAYDPSTAADAFAKVFK